MTVIATLAQSAAVAAVLTNAVVYGTDICYAMVTRSVFARLDDATMTTYAGWGHHYADRRMPPIGASGVIATVLTIPLAVAAGHAAAAVAAAVALAALVIWLACYVRVAKPINTAQTAAAQAGVTPPNARALQDRWDSFVPLRVSLQLLALGALCVSLALL
ncbi:MAG: DUF1772 domain-containing protein [Mycobacteriaceae bacterium]|nr:DUF1772 domain-containing protein [Mycobacteriaceae bacterium]